MVRLVIDNFAIKWYYHYLLPIIVIDLFLLCTDIKVCGNEGEDCFHSLGVLRVSLGCFVSLTMSVSSSLGLIILYLWSSDTGSDTNTEHDIDT
jgi:uncharacterized oligopeptide transporter (OPT) family protein